MLPLLANKDVYIYYVLLPFCGE